MNTHITEPIREDLPANFVCTDAPDPRVPLLGYHMDLARLPDAGIERTASVTCVVFIEKAGRWHAGLAFQHHYVSPAWLEELLKVLGGADLPRFAANYWSEAAVSSDSGPVSEPSNAAIALEVCGAGRLDAHLICTPGHQPPRWRDKLSFVLGVHSQDRYCGTLAYLSAFLGDPSEAEWAARSLATAKVS